ncbi:MAG TPA: GNAT family N-acetyltransferase [Jatrophihabitantaceae bacterium]|nr:GNAT family N-acetyltransferase [Jatrophihabitantaceae bacterium]
MTVRLATPVDAAGIATVHVHSWQVAYRGILSDAFLDGISSDRRTEQWLGILAQKAGRGCTNVIELDGQVTGFVHTGPSRDDDADPSSVGELIAIYVRPDAFGTGAGRALMAAALDWFATAGYAEATLWVLAGNARAIRFYERVGWHADGTRKQDAIGDEPVTELRYRHPVSMRTR